MGPDMGRKPFGFVVASALAAFGLTAAPTAQAAPAQGSPVLIVGQSQATCPGAQFDNIQAAINAAKSGGTVQICPGTYVAGNGLQGTNALTITKDLTLAGAGADQVTIEPRNSPASDGQIAENKTDIRDGKGDILAAIGKVQSPITVNISGITFDANGVYTTAGVVFVDAQGSLDHSRVTGVDINESAGAYSTPGGFRSNAFGYGVADVTRATPATAPTGSAAIRTLTVDHTRIDHYNAIGILIDGSTNDYSQYAEPPVSLVPSGIQNQAVLTNDQIIGRNLCQNYNDPTAGGPTVIDGDCEATGGSTPIPPPLPLTTGPLFGQDGVRVTGGASVKMTGDTVSSNLVNGTGAPVQSVFAPTPNNDPYPLGDHAENNQNLRLAAGVRLVGAGSSSITNSNITDNAFGVLNTALDGTTANTSTPVTAQNDWWGLRTGTVSLPTPGPAVWPNPGNPSSTTNNPPVPENPVNGAPVADNNCPSGISDSSAVTFCPYRDGDQADSLQGEYPIANAPGPAAAGAGAAAGSNSCGNSASVYDPNIPTYDGFFGTTLGSGTTGDG